MSNKGIFSSEIPERGCPRRGSRVPFKTAAIQISFLCAFSNACQSSDETGLRTFTSVDILCYDRNCQNVAKMDVDDTDIVFRHEYPRLASNISTRKWGFSAATARAKGVVGTRLQLHPRRWHWWRIWTPTCTNLHWNRPEMRCAVKP